MKTKLVFLELLFNSSTDMTFFQLPPKNSGDYRNLLHSENI